MTSGGTVTGVAPTRDARGNELEKSREVKEGMTWKAGIRKSGSGNLVPRACFKSCSGLQLNKVIRAVSSAENDLGGNVEVHRLT